MKAELEMIHGMQDSQHKWMSNLVKPYGHGFQGPKLCSLNGIVWKTDSVDSYIGGWMSEKEQYFT